MRRPGPGSFVCRTGPACNNHCTLCPVPQTEAAPGGASLLGRLRAARAGYHQRAVLAGGEPLLRGDVFRLLSAARALGLEPSVVTNGRLLFYETVRRRLAHSGCGHVRVQLFGGDEASHDAITRAPGSFAQAMAGVEAFQREHGDDVQVEIGLALTRDGAGDAAAAVERIAGRLPLFEIGLFVSVLPPLGAVRDVSPSMRSAMERLAGWNARRPLRLLLVWEGVAPALVPAPRHLRVDPPVWSGCCAQPVAAPVASEGPSCAARPARRRPASSASRDRPGSRPRDSAATRALTSHRAGLRGAGSVIPGDSAATRAPTSHPAQRWLGLALRRMRGRVLDVGGEGQPHRALILALARDGLVEHHHVAAIEDAAPQPGYFDYVLALGATDRFTDLARALSHMTRALRPGGSMLLTGRTPCAPLNAQGEVGRAEPATGPSQQPTRPSCLSLDLLPELRLLPLRVIFHRPASSEAGEQWILQAMKV